MDDQQQPKTSRDYALDALSDGAPGSAQVAQAFAMLAVADELAAIRVAFGGAARAVGPAIGGVLAGIGTDLHRIADGVGRVEPERTPAPAGRPVVDRPQA